MLGPRMGSPLDEVAFKGYTFGMKTAISLPERVFREAERFARRVRKTRSKLYAEAIAEYLARHAPNDITESMNQVCDRLNVPEDEFHGKAARRILSQEKW
jgi:predicted transcriptional regulator